MTPKEVADYLIANRRQCRTGKSRVCPVCGHADGYCLRMEDGSAALCPKTDGAGSIRRNGEYGNLYLLSSGLAAQDVSVLPPVRKVREQSDVELHTIWAPRARHWWRDRGAEIGRLAMVLGVAPWALDELCVGWDGRSWCFPERNGEGLIVGISRRFEDGSKRCATGSRRGLTYSESWADNPGPVLLVEGGSDVAAGITVGLAVIGRPSNTGGVEMLARLLKGHQDRRVAVVGERDRKSDGSCPGVDGARRVSQGLGKRLGRSVECRLPPVPHKDLRAWMNSLDLDLADREACFAAGQVWRGRKQ